MGGQRNKPQMKEQVNPPEKLDEMEASNLSDREFRAQVANTRPVGRIWPSTLFYLACYLVST